MAKFPNISMSRPTEKSVFVVITAVVRAMRDAGVEEAAVDACRIDIMSSPPSHMLAACRRWVVLSG